MNPHILFFLAIVPVIGFWTYIRMCEWFKKPKQIVDYYIVYIAILSIIYLIAQFFGLMKAV